MIHQLFLQLGNFAGLPPEVRLKIWEHLFATLQFRTQLPDPDCRGAPQNLSILCANKHLYGEISCHLYSRLTYTVRLPPSYDKQQWMAAWVTSRELSVECDFRDMADFQRHFQNFPHRRSRLRILIPAPRRWDPGQLVMLWQKANALVDVLIALHRASRCQGRQAVTIQLAGYWCNRGKPTESIKDRKGDDSYYSDVDLAVLPFCRLKSRWYGCLDIPRHLWKAMDDESTSPRRSELSRVRDAAPTRRRRLYFDQDSLRSLDLDNWLVEAADSVERAVDRAFGDTASLLRRDRLSSWYEDGGSWKSPYEEQLLSTFPGRFEAAHGNGIDLAASCWHRLVILLHHIAHAKRDDSEKVLQALKTDQPRLYTTWDSTIWEAVFPRGIPEFHSVFYNLPRWIRPYEEAVVAAYQKEIPQYSSFSDAIHWWAWNASYIFKGSKNKDYKCDICWAQKSPCRWCKEYDPDLLCGLCRAFNATGVWPKFHCWKCKCEVFDKQWHCTRWDYHAECKRCRDLRWQEDDSDPYDSCDSGGFRL